MGNEVIWYILLGLIYLLFGLRRKRSKQPAKRPPALDFEERLRQLTGAAADEIPHAVAPAVVPDAPPARAMVPSPQSFDFVQAAPKPSLADVPVASAPLAKQPLPQPPPQKRPAAAALPSILGASVADELKDPKAARNAVIMSTVLGKPRALQLPGGR